MDRFLRLSYELLNIVATENKEQDVLNGLNKLEQFFVSIDMPIKLSEVGIDDSNFELMADRITNYGKNNVVGFIELDKNKVLEILILSLPI